MYVRAGRPAFARPCVGIHKSTSLMSSSLLLQQCPACLVLKTCLGRWTIGRSGERGSGISVLPARYDDDDDENGKRFRLWADLSFLVPHHRDMHTHKKKKRIELVISKLSFNSELVSILSFLTALNIFLNPLIVLFSYSSY